MATPVITGVPAVTALSLPSSGAFTIDISKPFGLTAGEYVVVAVRMQQVASSQPTLAGFTYIGPAWDSTINFRTNALFGRWISNPDTEPNTWVLSGSMSAAARLVAVAMRIRNVNQATPVVAYSGTPITINNGRTTPSYSGATGGLTLFYGASEFSANNDHIPTLTPDGFTEVALATSPSSSAINVSRTAIWLGSKNSVVSETDATIMWSVVSGAAAYKITIRGGVETDPGEEVPVPVAVSAGTTHNNSIGFISSVDTSAVPLGAWMVVVAQASLNSADFTPPEGWRQLLPNKTQRLGSRTFSLWGKNKMPGDSIFTWTLNVETLIKTTLAYGTGARPVEEWSVGLVGVRSSGNVVAGQSVHLGTDRTTVAPGLNNTSAGSLVLAISVEATNAAESGIAGMTGATPWYYAEGNDSLSIGYAVKDTVGLTLDVVTSYENPQALNGAAVQIILPSNGGENPDISGYPQRMGNGATAHLTYLDGSYSRRAIASVRTFFRGFDSVEEMLDTPGATWAHRGGTDFFPEMSEFAYDQSAIRGYGALEFSAQRSSDGWWFGLHDNNFDSTMGTTSTPAPQAVTKAAILSSYVNKKRATLLHPSRPFMGLIEFLDKWTPTHVVIVDPKNALNHNTEFLNILDAHGGPDKIVWKFTGNSNAGSLAAQAAEARGYETWGYFYPTDVDNGGLALYANRWTMLGLSYDASQASWDALKAFGKPTVAHIAPTQAAYNMGIAKGADMVQCSGVLNITPVSAPR